MSTPARFATPGDLEPPGMVEHWDLSCACGATPILEKPGGSAFRFSCSRYWRGKHGVCWACASPRSRFAPVADLFTEPAPEVDEPAALVDDRPAYDAGRLFHAGPPTDTERAARRTTNRAAQTSLFDMAAPIELTPAPCPACHGIADACTCQRTGAEALTIF